MLVAVGLPLTVSLPSQCRPPPSEDDAIAAQLALLGEGSSDCLSRPKMKGKERQRKGTGSGEGVTPAAGAASADIQIGEASKLATATTAQAGTSTKFTARDVLYCPSCGEEFSAADVDVQETRCKAAWYDPPPAPHVNRRGAKCTHVFP